jgi:hypothetical protein
VWFRSCRRGSRQTIPLRFASLAAPDPYLHGGWKELAPGKRFAAVAPTDRLRTTGGASMMCKADYIHSVKEIISGQSRLTGGLAAVGQRSGWPDSTKAGTARSPQINSSAAGFPAAETRRSARVDVFRTGQTGPHRIRRSDSSTHHRASVIPASKKTLNRRWVPPGAAVDAPRARYEQLREHNLARIQTGWESDLLMQQGMRSWIEAGGPITAQPAASAKRQQTDANWQPIIPVVASP